MDYSNAFVVIRSCCGSDTTQSLCSRRKKATNKAWFNVISDQATDRLHRACGQNDVSSIPSNNCTGEQINGTRPPLVFIYVGRSKYRFRRRRGARAGDYLQICTRKVKFFQGQAHVGARSSVLDALARFGKSNRSIYSVICTFVALRFLF